MVFKRKAKRSFRGFAKKSRSYAGHSGIKPIDILLAGAIYGAARPFVAKFMPDLFRFGPVDSDNVLIGAAGFYGMKKGKGLIKALGAVALGSEAGIITARLASGVASNVGNAGTDAYQY
jgi:hypothetical protein